MLYTKKPEWFVVGLEVVGCFVEYDGKILLLQRQAYKSEWNLYGMPAWKIDPWETRDEAMKRELQEETWIVTSDDMKYIMPTYVQYDNERNIMYHLYHTVLWTEPEITLSTTEHKSYMWATPTEALQAPLMPDLDTCIRLVYTV